jgi:hypothetical protein
MKLYSGLRRGREQIGSHPAIAIVLHPNHFVVAIGGFC